MLIGDKVEFQKLMAGSVAAVVSVTAGTLTLASRLFRFSPLLGAGAVAFAAAAALRVRGAVLPDALQQIQLLFSRFESEVIAPNVKASTSLQTFMPARPNFDEVASSVAREAALGRACLYVLARSRCAPASRAADISLRLPFLTIEHDARRIGYVFRRFAAFFEPTERIWQAGRPVQITSASF